MPLVLSATSRLPADASLAVEAGATTAISSGVAIAIAVVLLVLNGGFVAAEISLLAARRSRIEEAAAAGDRRATRALRQLSELSVTFSGAQLGITACSLGLGAVAEPAVAAVFARWLDASPLPGGAVPAVAVVLALSLVLFLHMVIGETAPKNLALARAERVALALVRPVGLFIAVLRPVIVALNAIANALVRAVRVEPVDEHKLVHSPQELALVVAESQDHGSITPQDAQVIVAALRLADIDAEAAMTPRVDLVAVPEDATPQQVLEIAARSGHTRLPVFRDDVDHITGVVHIKRLLTAQELPASVAELTRPLPAVPETRDLESLLAEMLRDGAHAALVVDEYGGTAGLVTLEDVLEELVGDIEDEFDEDLGVRRRGDRLWMVPGTVRRDELARSIGLQLDAIDAETVSGWLTEELGRLVEAGDRVVTEDGWWLTVLTLEGRRAGEVEVRRPQDG